MVKMTHVSIRRFCLQTMDVPNKGKSAGEGHCKRQWASETSAVNKLFIAARFRYRGVFIETNSIARLRDKLGARPGMLIHDTAVHHD